MGSTEGSWRLKAIIILFLYIFCMYSIQAIFMESGDINNPDVHGSSGVGDSSPVTGSLKFFGIVDNFIKFLSFQSMGLPFFAWLPIAITISICSIAIAYILYTAIYEFVKALPLT